MTRLDGRIGQQPPRPVCEICGKDTSRTGTVAGQGKGFYQCTNTQCSNFLKPGLSYTRGSMERAE